MASSAYIPTDIKDTLNYVGDNVWNAIYTITLGELIEHDIFSWELDILNWSEAKYSDEQYTRVCNYFIERFRFREISIEPFYEWATILKRKLVYELMPKYKIMYQLLDDDFDITQTASRYNKGRSITSNYPETLLSGNADYASNGSDTENETIERGDLMDAYLKYNQEYQAIDKQLLDELESMFIGLYSVSLDGM